MVCVCVDDIDCLLRFTGVDAEDVGAAARVQCEARLGGEVGGANSEMENIFAKMWNSLLSRRNKMMMMMPGGRR